ncbi:SMI1/KNR4 family protein [Stenotrophomonas maltophilia]|uniref:SMI1/KNR4 family protein n=1 Tax=Stenotrophomonas maltophilia TaxID=40324 RepID=UPI001075EF08|nr:SMI1/KNR4 family protein [Stenotrophomonas maltophilia]TFZ44961.1 SMI1/KNR4 family protein [Stenotrophomonas maltophilia]
MNCIEELIGMIRSSSSHAIRSPAVALPVLEGPLAYPADMQHFYRECGGALLYANDPEVISYNLLPPEDIRQANEVIAGERCEDDLSATWHVVARSDNGDYISIDLSLHQRGCCYDSNHEIHGVAGSCPIIAGSFTELIGKLLSCGAGQPYWAALDCRDAYDTDAGA